MIYGSAKSLGIEITEGRINFAVVNCSGDGVNVIEAGGVDLADGTISGAKLLRPDALLEGIKSLPGRRKTRMDHACIAVPAGCIVSQIIELPEQMPENMSDFVRGEIRHSPKLTGREVCCDFRKTDMSPDTGGRLLVAGGNLSIISEIVALLRRSQIHAVSLEPAWIASLRALRALHVSEIADCVAGNLLFARLTETTLTICVFRKGRLDFVRDVGLNISGGIDDRSTDACVRHIETVMQYYDVQVEPVVRDQWRIALADDANNSSRSNLPDELRNRFGSKVMVYADQAIGPDNDIVPDGVKSSSAAVGLALKGFEKYRTEFDLDLLPGKFARRRYVEKLTVSAIRIAVMAIFAMVLGAGLVRARLNSVNQAIAATRPADTSKQDIELLTAQEKSLSEKYENLLARYDELNGIVTASASPDFSKIADQANALLLESVYMTAFETTQDGRNVIIRGRAQSFTLVHDYIRLLGGAEYIEEARLMIAYRRHREDNPIDYAISCQPAVIVKDNDYRQTMRGAIR